MSDDVHLIKKYASRRLYDVDAGKFITLEEIDQLIQNGERIKVIDADGNDITHSVLLQILTEHESDGEPLLSVDLLHQILRLYGNAMQGMFGQYMEEGMAFMQKQNNILRSMPTAMQDQSGQGWQRLMQQQMGLWQETQKAFLSGFAPAKAKPSRPADDDNPPPEKDEK